jgi:hypothetical protein
MDSRLATSQRLRLNFALSRLIDSVGETGMAAPWLSSRHHIAVGMIISIDAKDNFGPYVTSSRCPPRTDVRLPLAKIPPSIREHRACEVVY